MQGEPWSGEHRRGIAVCGLLKTTNSAASSKQAHFFRHWRRIACFPCFSIRPAAGGRFAKQIKEAPIKRGHPLGCPLFIGAGGGTRTHTVSLPTDFESVTSTNSITPALTLFIISDEWPKFKRNLCFRRKIPDSAGRMAVPSCKEQKIGVLCL